MIAKASLIHWIIEFTVSVEFLMIFKYILEKLPTLAKKKSFYGFNFLYMSSGFFMCDFNMLWNYSKSLLSLFRVYGITFHLLSTLFKKQAFLYQGLLKCYTQVDKLTTGDIIN